ncbi:MAG: hypothetical protein JWN89_643 [Parcubacteria group bacterium]|nr:hypothetical protein [Parcubacteria group bacterium]
MDVHVRRSRNGQGIFANRDFSAQEVIYEVKGKLITCGEDEDIDQRVRDNTFRFDKEKYLSPEGELGDFQNHSCEPNAGVFKSKKKLFIKAIKNIKEGKEILIDYSTILATDDTWTMKCNCGSANCRGIIKKFKNIPKVTKEKYLALGIVPEYILN